jgi:hypothetical protein
MAATAGPDRRTESIVRLRAFCAVEMLSKENSKKSTVNLICILQGSWKNFIVRESNRKARYHGRGAVLNNIPVPFDEAIAFTPINVILRKPLRGR